MTIFTLAQGAPAKAAPAKAPATTTTTQQAPAAPGAPAKKPGLMDGLGGMVPFLVIMGVFIYLMWSGQRKERKKKEEMLSAIKVGSEVITIGGIMGVIASVTDDHFVIQISDNAKIKVLKSAVSQVITSDNAEAGKDGK